MAERRVAERLAAGELSREEAGDVVARRVLHGARVGLERLDDDAARRLPPAPAGELGEELERPLLGAEVGQREAGVGVDDRGELDAREVVSLRDHLRADEDGALGGGEPLERGAELLRLRDGVGVEADPLELGDVLLELALELLRSGADAGELGRAARGARVAGRLARAAVVAAEGAVAVERERDVAVDAAARRAARAAVERGRDAAAVEQEDRLAAVLREAAELGEERRRERVRLLAAQVDDADGRHRRADPSAELDALERLPRLRPRRRGAEDRDGALERGPLRGDGAGVVARVGLLLVRGVVLLVDADDAERRERREDGGAGADDDLRFAARGCARARRGARPRRGRSGGARRARSARGSGRRSAG